MSFSRRAGGILGTGFWRFSPLSGAAPRSIAHTQEPHNLVYDWLYILSRVIEATLGNSPDRRQGAAAPRRPPHGLCRVERRSARAGAAGPCTPLGKLETPAVGSCTLRSDTCLGLS